MGSAPHWLQSGAKFLLFPEPRCGQLCPVSGRPASPRPDGLEEGKRVGRRPGKADHIEAPESRETWLRPAAGRTDRVCRENLQRAWRQMRNGLGLAVATPFSLGLASGSPYKFLAKNGPDNGSAPPLFFAGPCLACCRPRLFSDIRRSAKCSVFCYNRPGCEVGEASAKRAGNSFVEIRLPNPPSVARKRGCPGLNPRRQGPPDACEIGAMGPPIRDLPAREPPERPGAAP